MTQYQAPQGDAHGHGQQPGFPQPGEPAGGYGQASAPQAPQGPQGPGGYGQASMPQPPAPGYGQGSMPPQSGGYAQQPQGGYGYGGQYPTSGHLGLFDTTFAVSSTQETAKRGDVEVIILDGVQRATGTQDSQSQCA